MVDYAMIRYVLGAKCYSTSITRKSMDSFQLPMSTEYKKIDSGVRFLKLAASSKAHAADADRKWPEENNQEVFDHWERHCAESLL